MFGRFADWLFPWRRTDELVLTRVQVLRICHAREAAVFLETLNTHGFPTLVRERRTRTEKGGTADDLDLFGQSRINGS